MHDISPNHNLVTFFFTRNVGPWERKKKKQAALLRLQSIKPYIRIDNIDENVIDELPASPLVRSPKTFPKGI